jgi:uncharacterized protein (TIGR02145 family)
MTKRSIIQRAAISFCLLTSSFLLKAQAPQGIPYQAIARNASGQAIASTAVKVRFSIRDSIATGAIKYQETHNPTTSALGLFSVNVGMGTVVSGSFSGINWGKNAKFLQVELDPAGGGSYTDLGTTQMMSVPYALFAGSTNSFPVGGTEGQIITNCGGQPTWTTNGVCPGRISSLNCAGAVQSGTTPYATFPVQLSFLLSYEGGNGGPYQAVSVASTGISGLTAFIAAGNFNNGTGTLSISISGITLMAGTASFSFTIGGKSCSLNLNINALLPNTIVDIDGNLYNTINVGSQTWMKENLKVGKYRNGDIIPNNLLAGQWTTTRSGALTEISNPSDNFGKLYNFFAIADSRGLCPLGWHVPSDTEWEILENQLGGSLEAGGKLKTTGTNTAGTGYWASPNTGATNSIGFSALPAGCRGGTAGDIIGAPYYAYFWTSDEYGSNRAWHRWLYYSLPECNKFDAPKQSGFSIRCIKN